MIKKFDTLEYMTVEEIEEKFYPNRVLLVNCDERNHSIIGGYVVATETIPDDDYEELFNYETLLIEEKKHGLTGMVLTRLPFEGESLYAEFSE